MCGQQGTAFWGGRGGVVRNNTFKNIRNQDGTGVQGPSVQALYLDDQVSGATVLRPALSDLHFTLHPLSHPPS